MIRRNFIQHLALASTGAGMAAASATKKETITFRVKGFTCITCAVGLDTLLGREPGVILCKSDYAQARTTVEFDPSKTTASSIRKFISEMGFQAGG